MHFKGKDVKGFELEARAADRRQILAYDVAGWFDFANYLIQLKSIRSSDIEAVQKTLAGYKPAWNNGKPTWMSGEQYSVLAKTQPLVVHEYTHFIDSTSTLWGLKHLKLMSDAYSSRNAEERDYHHAKVFSDHIRSIKLPQYYTVINGKPHERQPWKSSITIGRVFASNGAIGTRTVLFSRFANCDGEVIVRSPISQVSILEASAMAQEIMSQAKLLQLTDPEYRLVEDKELTRKTMAFLYSREVTEYSVCVHVLANRLNCTDVLIAFRICSMLTRLTLNFPATLFQKIADSCPIEDVLKIPRGHDFGEAIRDGLRGHDLGAIYYLLCSALPDNTAQNDQAISVGIETALASLGVTKEELLLAAGKEADLLASSLKDSAIKNVRTLAQAGYENFRAISLYAQELAFPELNVPPAILGDDSISVLFGREENTLSKLDLEDCYFELDEGISWVSRFSEACL